MAFNAEFGKKLAKDVVTVFVVTAGGLLAVPGTGGLGRDLVLGAVVAGVKAVLGVLVKDVGEDNSPHL